MTILPFALIAVFGAVAFWIRNLPKLEGILALVSAAMMMVFLFMEPNPQSRYRYAIFAILGLGIGLGRLSAFPKKA